MRQRSHCWLLFHVLLDVFDPSAHWRHSRNTVTEVLSKRSHGTIALHMSATKWSHNILQITNLYTSLQVLDSTFLLGSRLLAVNVFLLTFPKTVFLYVPQMFP